MAKPRKYKGKLQAFALKKNMPISKSIIRKNIINFFAIQDEAQIEFSLFETGFYVKKCL